MDGALRAGRRGRLGRGRGPHCQHQPAQEARRRPRGAVTGTHGPVRDKGVGVNDLESETRTGRHEKAAGPVIPEQHARPHPVDPDRRAERAVAMEDQQHDMREDEGAGEKAVYVHRQPDPQDRSGARELFVRLRGLPAGSPERAELRDALVRMHLPLVEHLARRFRNRGEPLDDLTQVATIGLIKSVDRFDPERGVEFSTYATPTVVGEIKRHFRDKGWAVRVPRRLQELRLSLTTATAELSQQHGRAPTVHELAERLSISEEEVLEGLESANAYSTLSLDVPDTDDESPAVADTLGAEDDALEGVEYRESLKPLLEELPPREKKILLLRFFGNMTQSQIAQEVGISQMHVSRLLARTLAQLRDRLLIEE
ncbi:RNA polymerase sigma factor SigF [Streptomyces fenghuangensis]|uniref:RNA polymerase sigma factor SigF n=1 Tax=Streptomyces sp. ICN903 TaxID=2964654 RepID=UPI0035B02F13